MKRLRPVMVLIFYLTLQIFYDSNKRAQFYNFFLYFLKINVISRFSLSLCRATLLRVSVYLCVSAQVLGFGLACSTKILIFD